MPALHANILTPFSRLVTPKLPKSRLQPAGGYMIANITRRGMARQIQRKSWKSVPVKWAADYQEDRITIFYDTMSNNTA